ncbi:MAG TPA: hypothetical protein VI479_23495 [Blastocatellia bacterium]
MAMNPQAHSIETNRVPPSRLWFGVGAAAIAWTIQELLSVIIASLACQDGVYTWTWISAGGARALLTAITLGLLAVTVAAGFISFRNWRSLSSQRHLIRAEGRRREAFMALIGIFVSIVFVGGIIWAGIPLIMIDLCRSAR